LPQRMGGINFTIPLLKLSEQNHYRIGIVGGKNSLKLATNLKTRFPKLNLVKTWNGFFSSTQEKAIVEDIGKQKLDILLVAMGFPRQELFIDRHLKELNCQLAIGEGGSFDYLQLGGNLPRAPRFLQAWGLEWLWRLLLQPKRLLRQIAIVKFILLVYRQAKNYQRMSLR